MNPNDEIRAMLQERRQRRQSEEQYRDENGRFAKKTISDYVMQYKLPTTDLRVAALLSRDEEVDNPEKTVLRLARQIYQDKLSDADMPSHLATRKSYATLQERLMDEYNEGAKNLTGNALIRFKMEMRKKGLNIS